MTFVVTCRPGGEDKGRPRASRRYWDGTLKVHDAHEMRAVASSTGGHRGPIRAMSVSGDGHVVVTGGEDGTVRLWVLEHRALARALAGDDDPHRALMDEVRTASQRPRVTAMTVVSFRAH